MRKRPESTTNLQVPSADLKRPWGRRSLLLVRLAITLIVGAMAIAIPLRAFTLPPVSSSETFADWQQKLEPLRALLLASPSNENHRVAWQDDVSQTADEKQAAFYRAQYLMAPVVVVPASAGLSICRLVRHARADFTLVDATGKPFAVGAMAKPINPIETGHRLLAAFAIVLIALAIERGVRGCLPRSETVGDTLTSATLVLGLTLGTASTLLAVATACCDGSRLSPLWPLAAVSLIAFAASRSWSPAPPRGEAASVSKVSLGWMPWVVGWSFLLGAGFFVGQSIRHLHGEWDATAIWNLRARHLLAAAHERVPAEFDHPFEAVLDPAMEHTDYPLLLPGAVALGWIVAGSDTTLVPSLIAGLFAISVVLLSAGLVARVRGQFAGLLVGTILFGCLPFLRQAVAQYADIPVSFYLLASWGLAAEALSSRERSTRARTLLLAGYCGGLLAWTKNEGLALLVVGLIAFSLAAIVTRRWHRSASVLGWREVVLAAAGLVPVLGVVLLFKLVWAPPNDLVGQREGSELLLKLIDTDRLDTLLRHASHVVFKNGLWLVVVPVLLVLVGRRSTSDLRRRLSEPDVLFLGSGLLFAVGLIAVVYWTSPHEVGWHVDSSMSRVLMQLWPLGLLAAARWASPAILGAGQTVARSKASLGGESSFGPTPLLVK